jgi:hypothetical protein
MFQCSPSLLVAGCVRRGPACDGKAQIGSVEQRVTYTLPDALGREADVIRPILEGLMGL